MQHATAVLAFLRERAEEALSLAESLVAVESPSRDPATHPGAFAILETQLAGMGFARRFVKDATGRRHLLARPGRRVRRRPLQLLLGHIDTVWPVGTLSSMPLHRDDRRLAGPGTYDMKVGRASCRERV